MLIHTQKAVYSDLVSRVCNRIHTARNICPCVPRYTDESKRRFIHKFGNTVGVLQAADTAVVSNAVTTATAVVVVILMRLVEWSSSFDLATISVIHHQHYYRYRHLFHRPNPVHLIVAGYC